MWIFGLSPNVISLSLASFLNAIASEMVATLIPLYLANEIKVSNKSIGAIEGMSIIISIMIKLVAGLIADRFECYKLLTALGYLFAAIARPILLLSKSAIIDAFYLVLISRWLEKIGKGFRSSPRDGILSQSVLPRKRGISYSIHHVAQTAGSTVSLIFAWFLVYYQQQKQAQQHVEAFGVAAPKLEGHHPMDTTFELILFASIPFGFLATLVIWLFAQERDDAVRGVLEYQQKEEEEEEQKEKEKEKKLKQQLQQVIAKSNKNGGGSISPQLLALRAAAAATGNNNNNINNNKSSDSLLISNTTKDLTDTADIPHHPPSFTYQLVSPDTLILSQQLKNANTATTTTTTNRQSLYTNPTTTSLQSSIGSNTLTPHHLFSSTPSIHAPRNVMPMSSSISSNSTIQFNNNNNTTNILTAYSTLTPFQTLISPTNAIDITNASSTTTTPVQQQLSLNGNSNNANTQTDVFFAPLQQQQPLHQPSQHNSLATLYEDYGATGGASVSSNKNEYNINQLHPQHNSQFKQQQQQQQQEEPEDLDLSSLLKHTTSQYKFVKFFLTHTFPIDPILAGSGGVIAVNDGIGNNTGSSNDSSNDEEDDETDDDDNSNSSDDVTNSNDEDEGDDDDADSSNTSQQEEGNDDGDVAININIKNDNINSNKKSKTKKQNKNNNDGSESATNPLERPLQLLLADDEEEDDDFGLHPHHDDDVDNDDEEEEDSEALVTTALLAKHHKPPTSYTINDGNLPQTINKIKKDKKKTKKNKKFKKNKKQHITITNNSLEDELDDAEDEEDLFNTDGYNTTSNLDSLDELDTNDTIDHTQIIRQQQKHEISSNPEKIENPLYLECTCPHLYIHKTRIEREYYGELEKVVKNSFLYDFEKMYERELQKQQKHEYYQQQQQAQQGQQQNGVNTSPGHHHHGHGHHHHHEHSHFHQNNRDTVNNSCYNHNQPTPISATSSIGGSIDDGSGSSINNTPMLNGYQYRDTFNSNNNNNQSFSHNNNTTTTTSFFSLFLSPSIILFKLKLFFIFLFKGIIRGISHIYFPSDNIIVQSNQQRRQQRMWRRFRYHLYNSLITQQHDILCLYTLHLQYLSKHPSIRPTTTTTTTTTMNNNTIIMKNHDIGNSNSNITGGVGDKQHDHIDNDNHHHHNHHHHPHNHNHNLNSNNNNPKNKMKSLFHFKHPHDLFHDIQEIYKQNIEQEQYEESQWLLIIIVILLLCFGQIFTVNHTFLILLANNQNITLQGIIGIVLLYNLIYSCFTTPAGLLSDSLRKNKHHGGIFTIVIGWLFRSLVFIYLGYNLSSSSALSNNNNFNNKDNNNDNNQLIELTTSMTSIIIAYIFFGLYAAFTEGTIKSFLTDVIFHLSPQLLLQQQKEKEEKLKLKRRKTKFQTRKKQEEEEEKNNKSKSKQQQQQQHKRNDDVDNGDIIIQRKQFKNKNTIWKKKKRIILSSSSPSSQKNKHNHNHNHHHHKHKHNHGGGIPRTPEYRSVLHKKKLQSTTAKLAATVFGIFDSLIGIAEFISALIAGLFFDSSMVNTWLYFNAIGSIISALILLTWRSYIVSNNNNNNNNNNNEQQNNNNTNKNNEQQQQQNNNNLHNVILNSTSMNNNTNNTLNGNGSIIDNQSNINNPSASALLNFNYSIDEQTTITGLFFDYTKPQEFSTMMPVYSGKSNNKTTTISSLSYNNNTTTTNSNSNTPFTTPQRYNHNHNRITSSSSSISQTTIPYNHNNNYNNYNENNNVNMAYILTPPKYDIIKFTEPTMHVPVCVLTFPSSSSSSTTTSTSTTKTLQQKIHNKKNSSQHNNNQNINNSIMFNTNIKKIATITTLAIPVIILKKQLGRVPMRSDLQLLTMTSIELMNKINILYHLLITNKILLYELIEYQQNDLKLLLKEQKEKEKEEKQNQKQKQQSNNDNDNIIFPFVSLSNNNTTANDNDNDNSDGDIEDYDSNSNTNLLKEPKYLTISQIAQQKHLEWLHLQYQAYQQQLRQLLSLNNNNTNNNTNQQQQPVILCYLDEESTTRHPLINVILCGVHQHIIKRRQVQTNHVSSVGIHHHHHHNHNNNNNTTLQPQQPALSSSSSSSFLSPQKSINNITNNNNNNINKLHIGTYLQHHHGVVGGDNNGR